MDFVQSPSVLPFNDHDNPIGTDAGAPTTPITTNHLKRFSFVLVYIYRQLNAKIILSTQISCRYLKRSTFKQRTILSAMVADRPLEGSYFNN